jgi:hypothetical protein
MTAQSFGPSRRPSTPPWPDTTHAGRPSTLSHTPPPFATDCPRQAHLLQHLHQLFLGQRRCRLEADLHRPGRLSSGGQLIEGQRHVGVLVQHPRRRRCSCCSGRALLRPPLALALALWGLQVRVPCSLGAGLRPVAGLTAREAPAAYRGWQVGGAQTPAGLRKACACPRQPRRAVQSQGRALTCSCSAQSPPGTRSPGLPRWAPAL